MQRVTVLQRLMDAHGLSLQGLAQEAGISKTTAHHMAHGRSIPQRERHRIINDVLNVFMARAVRAETMNELRDELERLRFILHCRRHGMTLAEIRELLAFRDRPHQGCGWVGELVERHIAAVSEQIEALTTLRDQLEQLRSTCTGKEQGTCGIIEQLSAPCPYCADHHQCLLHGNALPDEAAPPLPQARRGKTGGPKKA